MEDVHDIKKPLLKPSLPCWWRVLPALFIISTIGSIDNFVLNDFIEYRYRNYYKFNASSTENDHEICLNASRTSHNSTHLLSTTTSIYPISTTTPSKTEKVQEATARLNVYVSLAATIPSILVSIYLGANCDHIGRKPLIILPFIGKCIRYAILTAVAYYDLSNLWILLSVMLDGISGTGALSILSSFAFVTDCTDKKTRNIGTIVTDVCIASSSLLPLLTLGMYLKQPRYVQTMIFTFGLSLLGLTFSIFFQPESNLNVQHLNMFQQFKRSEFKAIKRCLHVFFVKRQDHKQRSLLMLVTTHLLFIVMIIGHLTIYYLYLYGSPFCFLPFDVSLNSTIKTVTVGVLTIVFTLTIAHRTDHLILPIFGCLALMAQCILFGIAKVAWILHLAIGISGIYPVLSPIIRSRITKLVEPNEYAVVFILASVFESGGFYAISAATNEIYRLSLSFYPGLVYLCIASIGVLTILVMLILYVLEYESSKKKEVLLVND